MIEIESLHKVYGRRPALQNFSLRVDHGELFGLVGPNGAGKTTLIKILATLQAPDSGRALINGRDVVSAGAFVRTVTGYLPDVPGLYQDMRVEEFLEFFADAFHLHEPRRRQAIDRALARAGLAARRNDFVELLSFGMKQRLVLAKTLLHDPRVLLLDEPATGLDPLAPRRASRASERTEPRGPHDFSFLAHPQRPGGHLHARRSDRWRPQRRWRRWPVRRHALRPRRGSTRFAGQLRNRNRR